MGGGDGCSTGPLPPSIGGASGGFLENEEEAFWYYKESEYFPRIGPKLLALLRYHIADSESVLNCASQLGVGLPPSFGYRGQAPDAHFGSVIAGDQSKIDSVECVESSIEETKNCCNGAEDALFQHRVSSVTLDDVACDSIVGLCPFPSPPEQLEASTEPMKKAGSTCEFDRPGRFEGSCATKIVATEGNRFVMTSNSDSDIFGGCNQAAKFGSTGLHHAAESSSEIVMGSAVNDQQDVETIRQCVEVNDITAGRGSDEIDDAMPSGSQEKEVTDEVSVTASESNGITSRRKSSRLSQNHGLQVKLPSDSVLCDRDPSSFDNVVDNVPPAFGGLVTSLRELHFDDQENGTKPQKSSSCTTLKNYVTADDSLFMWVPGSNNDSLKSTIHHAQLKVHLNYQTRDVGMAYKHTGPSPVEELLRHRDWFGGKKVRTEKGGSVRPQRRHGSSRSCAGGSRPRTRVKNSQSVNDEQESDNEPQSAGNEELEGSEVFDPIISKAWDGKRLPPIDRVQPDAFVLSMIVPPNISPHSFSGDIDNCSTVDEFFSALMKAANEGRKLDCTHLATIEDSINVTIDSNDGVTGSLIDRLPERSDERKPNISNTGCRMELPNKGFMLPILLSGPSPAWRGEGCNSTLPQMTMTENKNEPVNGGMLGGNVCAYAALPDEYFDLPIYAGNFLRLLQKRKREMICCRLRERYKLACFGKNGRENFEMDTEWKETGKTQSAQIKTVPIAQSTAPGPSWVSELYNVVQRESHSPAGCDRPHRGPRFPPLRYDSQRRVMCPMSNLAHLMTRKMLEVNSLKASNKTYVLDNKMQEVDYSQVISVVSGEGDLPCSGMKNFTLFSKDSDISKGIHPEQCIMASRSISDTFDISSLNSLHNQVKHQSSKRVEFYGKGDDDGVYSEAKGYRGVTSTDLLPQNRATNELQLEGRLLIRRLLNLAAEKQALLLRLHEAIAADKRPDLAAWAKLEDKMVAHYIEQSISNTLDTRHTYTLAHQTRDILRLRVTCVNSHQLPAQWTERALCTVCGSGEDWDEDPIMFCDGCYMPTHFLCLGHSRGYKEALQQVGEKRRRLIRQAGGDQGMSLAVARKQLKISQTLKANADRGTLTAVGSNGQQDRAHASSSRAGVGDHQHRSNDERAGGGSSGFFASQEDDEHLLCPGCEWIRKQLPILDDDIAFAAIRLAAGPRTLSEGNERRYARNTGWSAEEFGRFDSWVPPRLLAVTFGDDRMPKGHNYRRMALIPNTSFSMYPPVRIDRSFLTRSKRCNDRESMTSIGEDISASESFRSNASLPACHEATESVYAEQSSVIQINAAGNSATGTSSCSSSSKNFDDPVDYLRQIPYFFSDSEGEDELELRGSKGSSPEEEAQIAPPVLKYHSKDPRKRCVVEVMPVPGLFVTVRIPICSLCGFDAFCPGGGPVRKTMNPKVWAHIRCALAVNALVTEKGISYQLEENRSKLRCQLCHHVGPAPIQCSHASCSKPFHLPCLSASPGYMTDWDSGRPVIFCTVHSKDKAPTLILRKYQASREREKARLKALEAAQDVDIVRARTNFGLADALFPSSTKLLKLIWPFKGVGDTVSNSDAGNDRQIDLDDEACTSEGNKNIESKEQTSSVAASEVESCDAIGDSEKEGSAKNIGRRCNDDGDFSVGVIEGNHRAGIEQASACKRTDCRGQTMDSFVGGRQCAKTVSDQETCCISIQQNGSYLQPMDDFCSDDGTGQTQDNLNLKSSILESAQPHNEQVWDENEEQLFSGGITHRLIIGSGCQSGTPATPERRRRWGGRRPKRRPLDQNKQDPPPPASHMKAVEAADAIQAAVKSQGGWLFCPPLCASACPGTVDMVETDEMEVAASRRVGDTSDAIRLLAVIGCGLTPWDLCQEKLFLSISDGCGDEAMLNQTLFDTFLSQTRIFPQLRVIEAIVRMLTLLGVCPSEAYSLNIRRLSADIAAKSLRCEVDLRRGPICDRKFSSSGGASNSIVCCTKASTLKSSKKDQSLMESETSGAKGNTTGYEDSKLRPDVSAILATLNASDGRLYLCSLCGALGRHSDLQRILNDNPGMDRRTLSCVDLLSCTQCRVKVCKTCWASVARTPMPARLSDSAARAGRLQRRRACRDLEAETDKDGSGSVSGKISTGSLPECESIDDVAREGLEWTCFRCEALASGEMCSISATRCILCSRIDGLLVRRFLDEGKKHCIGNRPHPADPILGEVQWVHSVCAEWLVPGRLSGQASENIRAISRTAFDQPCAYCGLQGATITCSHSSAKCTQRFHVSCARLLGCRMEGQRRSSEHMQHRSQCLFHSLQHTQRLIGNRIISYSDLSAKVLQERRDASGFLRYVDPLQALVADPIQALRKHFFPGLWLMPSCNDVKGIALATSQIPVSSANTNNGSIQPEVIDDAGISGEKRSEATDDINEHNTAATSKSKHAVSTEGVNGTGEDTHFELRDNDYDLNADDLSACGSITPAPPSPMHLAEQRELVFATEAVAERVTEQQEEMMQKVWVKLSELLNPLPAALNCFGPQINGNLTQFNDFQFKGTSGVSYKRALPVSCQTPHHNEKCRRVDNSLRSSRKSSLAFEEQSPDGEVLSDTQEQNGKEQEINPLSMSLFKLERKEPIVECAPSTALDASARRSALWFGGLCGSSISTSEGKSADGTSALQMGDPGHVEGESKPVYCPICQCMYKELPDGSPGDGMHWIGCDGCLKWYHWFCSGYTDDHPPPETDDWYCFFCAVKIRKEMNASKKKELCVEGGKYGGMSKKHDHVKS